jgi:hypothetical protein
MAEAALNQAPFGSATKRRPIRAGTFWTSAKARFALAWPLSRKRFPAVRYRGCGDVAVLISLKVIFFEPSTLSGLGGRFLDRG